MEGYLLYRKEGKTAIVLTTEDDDELHYLLSKLHRSRKSWLKDFAGQLLEDFFEKTTQGYTEPPVKIIKSDKH